MRNEVMESEMQKVKEERAKNFEAYTNLRKEEISKDINNFKQWFEAEWQKVSNK